MIKFVLPFMPPTTNKAYKNVKGLGRVLTEDGRSFKTSAKAYLAQMYMKELATFRKNVPYTMLVTFYFERIENKGKGKVTKKGITARYKSNDVTNRIKLLEDCIKDVTDVDDSHTTLIALQKKQTSTDKEFVTIFIWQPESESSPLDELTERLTRKL